MLCTQAEIPDQTGPLRLQQLNYCWVVLLEKCVFMFRVREREIIKSKVPAHVPLLLSSVSWDRREVNKIYSTSWHQVCVSKSPPPQSCPLGKVTDVIWVHCIVLRSVNGLTYVDSPQRRTLTLANAPAALTFLCGVCHRMKQTCRFNGTKKHSHFFLLLLWLIMYVHTNLLAPPITLQPYVLNSACSAAVIYDTIYYRQSLKPVFYYMNRAIK